MIIYDILNIFKLAIRYSQLFFYLSFSTLLCRTKSEHSDQKFSCKDTENSNFEPRKVWHECHKYESVTIIKYDMSPFLKFAIVLTVAYVIYYCVMIIRDLYGKKDEVKTNEEVFDVSELEEQEAAVTVSESENGFSVADKQYETLRHEDDVIPAQQEEQPLYDIKQPEQKSVAENLEEQMQDKMEDTDMFMENQLMQDDFTACLLNGGDIGIGNPKVLATLINDEI